MVHDMQYLTSKPQVHVGTLVTSLPCVDEYFFFVVMHFLSAKSFTFCRVHIEYAWVRHSLQHTLPGLLVCWA